MINKIESPVINMTYLFLTQTKLQLVLVRLVNVLAFLLRIVTQIITITI